MQLIGLARLGRDAELRQTANGAVAGLSLAFNYGRKGDDGSRPTQWVDASLWGKLAEALIDYLVKGQQVVVTMDEVHIETFEGRNGPGHKLVGRISSIELAGGRPAEPAQRPPGQQPAARQASASAPAQHQNQAFDNFDDDIPFN